MLSAVIITRSFPPCSTAVADCCMHIIVWEWRERGRKGKKETEGTGWGWGTERDWNRDGRGRQAASFVVWAFPLCCSWRAPVAWDVHLLFLSHLAGLVSLKLWASCHAGCDFGVERYVILHNVLQLFHLVHSRKIKVCSSAGGKAGWLGLNRDAIVFLWPFLRILRVILTMWFGTLTSYKVNLTSTEFLLHFLSQF